MKGEQFNYTITVDGESIDVEGVFNEVEDGFNDHVEFSQEGSADVIGLSMDKTFEDTEQTQVQFDFPTGFEGETVSLYWNMDGTYEGDQISQNHTFYAEDGTTVTQDTFALNIDVTESTLNEVGKPEMSETVDLGSMGEPELERYFNNLGEQFMEWIEVNSAGIEQGF